jgi:hypothetical protein
VGLKLVESPVEQKTEREHKSHRFYYASELNEKYKLIEQTKAEIAAIKKEIKLDGYAPAEIEYSVKLLTKSDKLTDKHHLERGELERAGLIRKSSHKDLFGDRVNKEEMTFEQGVFAGALGEVMQSHYDAGSTDDKNFINGYKEGQRMMKEDLPIALEKAANLRGQS